MDDGARRATRELTAMRGRGDAAWDLASAGVVAVVLAAVLTTFRDFGITWDETWHLVYGDAIVEWFRTGGHDTTALCYRVDYLYGGGFDLLGALARRASPLGKYETIHLVGALVGIVGLCGTWHLARRLGGPPAGFVAVVLLSATPVWFGHMFNNPKDLPFAVGHVWAIDALCGVAMVLPAVSRRRWVVLAVLCGSAMSVRIGGMVVLCYLVGLVGALAWARARRVGPAAGAAVLGRLMRPTLAVIAGAWVVMIATWPWALLDPLRRPWLALGRMSRYTIHERTMPFAGEPMRTTEPRWDYLLHYFGFKLPAVVLVLVLAAIVLAVLAIRRHRGAALATGRGRALAVLAVAIAFPPLYAIVAQSVLYDGLRHFLFLVPLVCAVAGVAAVELARTVGRTAQATFSVCTAVAIGLTGKVVADMKTLHPHEYVYFNQFIGGLPGAFGNYDTDYYGNSYKEAFAALAEQLWRDDRQAYLDEVVPLSGCIPDFIARQYVEPSFRWIDRDGPPSARKDPPHYYLGYTRANCHNRYKNSPVVLEVSRMGTLLTVVRDLRRAGDRAGEADREDERDEPGGVAP